MKEYTTEELARRREYKLEYCNQCFEELGEFPVIEPNYDELNDEGEWCYDYFCSEVCKHAFNTATSGFNADLLKLFGITEAIEKGKKQAESLDKWREAHNGF